MYQEVLRIDAAWRRWLAAADGASAWALGPVELMFKGAQATHRRGGVIVAKWVAPVVLALLVCNACGSSGQAGASELVVRGTSFRLEMPMANDVKVSTGLASPLCVRGKNPIQLLKLDALDPRSKLVVSDFAIAPQNYEDAWVDAPLKRTPAASGTKVVTKKCSEKSERTSFLVIELKRKAMIASVDKFRLIYAVGGRKRSVIVPFGVFMCPRGQFDTPKCQF